MEQEGAGKRISTQKAIASPLNSGKIECSPYLPDVGTTNEMRLRNRLEKLGTFYGRNYFGKKDREYVSKLILEECRNSGVLYRGLRFGSVGELLTFIDDLRSEKHLKLERGISLTALLGVATGYACNPTNGIGLVLALDYKKLRLENAYGYGYYDTYPNLLREAEIKTDFIPPDTVKGMTLYYTNNKCNVCFSYIGIPKNRCLSKN